jgi:hypothetical protein
MELLDFYHSPTSSDVSNWGVLSWNPVSSQTTNSDHFLIPDDPESCRMRTDPKIGSDRFRLYESDRNAVNPISGYQWKTVDMIGIRWKVTDRIRLAVWQRNWNPSDRIRRTHFDLGLRTIPFATKTLIHLLEYVGYIWRKYKIVKWVKVYLEQKNHTIRKTC